MERATIAVVGGGISGLSAAWELSRLGVSGVVVLEAAERPGGVIASERHAGFVMERGADSFLAAKPAAGELCRELGLEAEVLSSLPGGARVLHRGKLEAIPAGWAMIAPGRLGPVLSSPLFSLRTKAAVAARWGRRAAAAASDEPVAAYLRRRFGRSAGNALARTLAGPMLGGVYGGDVEALSLAAVHTPRREGTAAAGAVPSPPFRSLRSGMGGLVEGLAAQLPAGWLRTRTEVAAIRGDAGGYRLQLTQGEDVHTAKLLVATPAWRAAELLGSLDEGLGAALAAIPYASSVNINLAYAQSPALPAGTGFLAPRREGVRLLACTFAHQKFDGRVPRGGGLVRVFYGDDAAGWSDEAVRARAREELHAAVGIRQAPDVTCVQRAVRAMPQYTVGHGARVAAIAAGLERHPNLQLAGNAYQGVGVPDCIASGRQAARALAGGSARQEAGA